MEVDCDYIKYLEPTKKVGECLYKEECYYKIAFAKASYCRLSVKEYMSLEKRIELRKKMII